MSPRSDSGPLTKSQLLRDVRDLRNSAAWQEFVDTYGPYLAGILKRRGIPRDDALDLVQETFLAVMKHIGHFQYDHRRRFRAWLATIAIRKAWRFLEMQGRRQPAPGGTSNLWMLGNLAGGEADWETQEARLQIVLQRTLTLVNPLEWRAFQMTVLECIDNQTAAQTLGIEIGYLYVCKSRVKRVLKEVQEETDE